ALTAFLKETRQEKGDEVYLADSTLYLEYFSISCIAWQWLIQGITIQKSLQGKVKKKDQKFYKGKMAALSFFYAYELPKTLGLEVRLRNNDGLTVNTTSEYFVD
ncbi:MAG: acyl-CoA dehydrogenase C-terminal domain-containing protein, partial [Deltaproteobacteria bacterium]|nr:acyl-CoA dehydrogenase C-terminal domain-containing protein [Deltaproteobacteria bacterium]